MDLVWGFALLPSLCKMIPKPWMRKIQLLLHTQGKIAYKTPTVYSAKVKKMPWKPALISVNYSPALRIFRFFLEESKNTLF